MTEERITTKAGLLAHAERDYTALVMALGRLSERQLTDIYDAQGWAVKDHLVHLTAWERSVVFLLQGRARHLGLGVDETVFLRGNDDEINAAIFQQSQALPWSTVLAEFQNTHQQLLALLQSLADEDLHRSYCHYLPNEPSEGDGPPIINLLYGNTAHHFREHLGWIEMLVQR